MIDVPFYEMRGRLCELFDLFHEMTFAFGRSSRFPNLFIINKGVGSDRILFYYQALACPWNE